jgi:hypothetical protein
MVILHDCRKVIHPSADCVHAVGLERDGKDGVFHGQSDIMHWDGPNDSRSMKKIGIYPCALPRFSLEKY